MTDDRTRTRRANHPPPSDQRERIAVAALALFTTQGFHGTNTREIANLAGVSSAAIYTFYASKEAIFADLAQQYRARLDDFIDTTVSRLKDPLSKRDLLAARASARQHATTKISKTTPCTVAGDDRNVIPANTF